jgi:hypothetical protein
MNEVDVALRREVHAVDDLDRAAIAAAGIQTLSKEIELAVRLDDHAPRADLPVPRAEETPTEFLEELEAEYGPCPPLPPATADWSQRRAALKRFADWLVYRCGLTQAEAADLLNHSGHRTQHGRTWRRWTVSALVNARYDRRSAA